MSSPAEARLRVCDLLTKPSLNVAMTIRDMEGAQRFYGELLGLERMESVPLDPAAAGAGPPSLGSVPRYRVGGHEIKLYPGVETTRTLPGGVGAGVGIRMVNFPIPEIAAFRERLREHGLATPEIRSLAGTSYRFGLLEDPDGNAVEFFFHAGDGPEGWRESIQVALTVTDVPATARFLSDVLGMEPVGCVPVPNEPDRAVHLFRNGPTLIKVFSGPRLPNCAGLLQEAYGYRCLEYHVRDVASVEALVRSRGYAIVEPRAGVAGGSGKLSLLSDPDGIIHRMLGAGDAR